MPLPSEPTAHGRFPASGGFVRRILWSGRASSAPPSNGASRQTGGHTGMASSDRSGLPAAPNPFLPEDSVEGAREHPLVLVVGRSRVNGIVVGRIVERCGLRPVTVSPEEAPDALRRASPSIVVLDGGSDNRDCHDLLPTLAALRATDTPGAPAVILLSTRNLLDGTETDPAIDAVVAKPILPEVLQPVVGRLRDRVLG